jgi:hypothetical protein
MAKNPVDLGGQLGDLADRTGISGQTLAGLRTRLAEEGVSLDQFAAVSRSRNGI